MNIPPLKLIEGLNLKVPLIYPYFHLTPHYNFDAASMSSAVLCLSKNDLMIY
jgi:hypothetical protein